MLSILSFTPEASIPEEEVGEWAVGDGCPPLHQDLDVLISEEGAVGHQALGKRVTGTGEVKPNL